MVRTTQAKLLSWGDWEKARRVARHFSHFKKHSYQSCSKEGKLREGGSGVAGSNRKSEMCSFCGKVRALI